MESHTPHTGIASKKLDDLIERYERNRNRWANGYYASRGCVIALGAAIPIMTTVDTLPRTAIAIAGGAIVVIEGVSRLGGFHERYIASRVLFKSLSKERLLFDTSAGSYKDVVGDERERSLAVRMVALLDMYDTQIFDALTKPDNADKPPADKP